jgi:hypothetical protein
VARARGVDCEPVYQPEERSRVVRLLLTEEEWQRISERVPEGWFMTTFIKTIAQETDLPAHLRPEPVVQKPPKKRWWQQVRKFTTTRRYLTVQVEDDPSSPQVGLDLPDGNEDADAIEALDKVARLEADYNIELSPAELREISRQLRADSIGDTKLANAFEAHASIRSNQQR